MLMACKDAKIQTITHLNSNAQDVSKNVLHVVRCVFCLGSIRSNIFFKGQHGGVALLPDGQKAQG